MIDSLPEGTAEESRRAQRFTCVIDAYDPAGRLARGVVRGPDTYGSTAIIAVEAARRLVADGAEPGVLAPAQAFDPAGFLGFLGGYGISSTIDLPGTPSTGVFPVDIGVPVVRPADHG